MLHFAWRARTVLLANFAQGVVRFWFVKAQHASFDKKIAVRVLRRLSVMPSGRRFISARVTTLALTGEMFAA